MGGLGGEQIVTTSYSMHWEELVECQRLRAGLDRRCILLALN